MRKVQRIIGGILVFLVLIINFVGVGVYGAAIDKALIHVNVNEKAHESAETTGLDVAESLEDEGIVLLRNSGVLPLITPLKINLLGYRAYDPVYSGSGSGGSAYLANRVSLVQALEDEGFTINPEVSTTYAKRVSSGENTFKVDFSIYEYAANAELATALNQEYLFKDSCSFEAMRNYSNVAVIVIGRAGGEDNDLPMDMTDYASYPEDQGKHYLELNAAERSLLKEARRNFDTVIVLVNTSNAMELGFLEEYDVDAALWIGSPGDVGMRSVAGTVSGRLNPSGRTVDTYPYAVEAIPSYANFGEYSYLNTSGLFARKKNEPQTAFLVNYREGIYVGYRYFETRERFDYVTREGETVQDAVYSEVVQFPFGFGLSYTEFRWVVDHMEVPEKLTPNDTIRFSVSVTNTGERPGQDVVELYYTPPYHSESGIQKSSVVLGDFSKTTLLDPGESQIVSLEIPVQDMASYDEGFYTASGAYVLESGDYIFTLRRDAHTSEEQFTFKSSLTRTALYADSVKETYSDAVDCIGMRVGDTALAENRFQKIMGNFQTMDRESWTLLSGTDEEADAEKLEAFLNARELDETLLRRNTTSPVQGKVTSNHRLTFGEMKGLKYDDPAWEDLLNQLSWRDMAIMLGVNGWGSSATGSIRKPQLYDMDGPSAISYILDMFMNRLTYKSVCYPSEAVIASTWNRELAREFGLAISGEGKAFGVSGWYAPGVNIHRNPFAGRNFEYYSEDPLLSGCMASEVVQSCLENGMICYVKHFALNEMETHRHYGVCTWASEQSMREIYLRAFEIPVKAGALAIMSAYNNLGTIWAGGCRALLTDVLRNEWGFEGIILTDNFEDHGFMDLEVSLAAGGTALLYNGMGGVNTMKRLRSTSGGQNLIREAAHRYLYVMANSMGGDMPWQIPLWRKFAISLSAVLLVSGMVLLVLPVRKRQREDII